MRSACCLSSHRTPELTRHNMMAAHWPAGSRNWPESEFTMLSALRKSPCTGQPAWQAYLAVLQRAPVLHEYLPARSCDGSIGIRCLVQRMHFKSVCKLGDFAPAHIHTLNCLCQFSCELAGCARHPPHPQRKRWYLQAKDDRQFHPVFERHPALQATQCSDGEQQALRARTA